MHGSQAGRPTAPARFARAVIKLRSDAPAGWPRPAPRSRRRWRGWAHGPGLAGCQHADLPPSRPVRRTAGQALLMQRTDVLQIAASVLREAVPVLQIVQGTRCGWQQGRRQRRWRMRELALATPPPRAPVGRVETGASADFSAKIPSRRLLAALAPDPWMRVRAPVSSCSADSGRDSELWARLTDLGATRSLLLTSQPH